MADFLTLNGIPVPVLDGSASLSVDELGDDSRALDGTLLLNRRNLKTSLEVDVVHQDAATALAFRDLILGRGNVWSFDTSLYSAKGVPAAGSGVVDTAQKKFGAASLRLGSASAEVFADGPDYTAQPWSCSFWLYDGVSWTHYVENSLNAQYVNGVFTGTRQFVSQSSTSVIVTNIAGANRWFDDVWLCPYLWPSTWPAKVFALNAAVGAAARVRAAGLALNANSGFLTMKGSVKGMKLEQGFVSGVLAPNLHVVSASLKEV